MKVYNHILITFAFLMACQPNRVVDTQEMDKTWVFKNFKKLDQYNPILLPEDQYSFDCPISKIAVNWQEKNVLNPTAVIKDGKVHLIYRAQDSMMTSRLGLAISEDGIHFKKEPTPIFFPDNDNQLTYEWAGGVEDPRIVESEDGRYIMTYTSYDGKTARLCIASSKDLIKWEKHGLVFLQEKYRDSWSKSGAIVCSLIENRVVATKINGKYWMYFGDTDLFMASSDDLITWSVLENNENDKMVSVLHPRPGYFDSRLVEPGPYALIQKEGILLIYNASNASNYNEGALSKFTYAAGQALFDSSQPYKLLDRSDSYFIKPDKEYELEGEVNSVCFVEGMVYFKNKWFLYYGTADRKIAVATKE